MKSRLKNKPNERWVWQAPRKIADQGKIPRDKEIVPRNRSCKPVPSQAATLQENCKILSFSICSKSFSRHQYHLLKKTDEFKESWKMELSEIEINWHSPSYTVSRRRRSRKDPLPNYSRSGVGVLEYCTLLQHNVPLINQTKPNQTFALFKSSARVNRDASPVRCQEEEYVRRQNIVWFHYCLSHILTLLKVLI